MTKTFQFFKPRVSINQVLRQLKTKPAEYWEKQGEKTVLRLFHFVAETVPAYRKFLQEHKISPEKIKTISDFKNLPLIDKNSYLRRYPYIDLFPYRNLSIATTVSATSGSTGEPFYFPRGEDQDFQYEHVAEVFLRDQFEIDKKKTLAVIGFGLGIWIGGIFTYKVLNKLSQKGYQLTVVPVGTHKDLFLKSVKKFGSLYDQIILMGYPPLVKDLIDEGRDYGIRWSDYRVRILTAAEGFSEKFRDYLAKTAFLKNPVNDTINIYGTVELGTMAHETAFTNLIRKFAADDQKVFRTLFPNANHLPTLAQYYPYFVYFEEADGEVVSSGYGSAIPLIRYRFPDIGGVIKFEEMIQRLKYCGVDIYTEAKKHKIAEKIMKLPFVYIYGRADYAIILRGANIYPGEIRHALDHKSLHQFVTGKFTMIKREDRNLNEYFEVNVELKKGIKASKRLSTKILSVLIEDLRQHNSEFNDQYTSNPKRTTPKVILWPYNHPKYFTSGLKQKWIKSS
jgi:phenylacetate-CoA ligase